MSGATDYLRPTPGGRWRWSPDGEVVMWPDGTTIAFRAELRLVLGTLAPGGLPPFGSVVLLLAACREGGPADVERQLGETLPSALRDGLRRIGRLPAALRTPVEARSILAGTVFEEGGWRVDPELAAAVLDLLDDPVPGRLERLCRLRPAAGDAAAAAGALVAGLERTGASLEDLALRLRTGLGELPSPARLELAPCEQIRLLLAELRDDPELAALAALARNLMAVTALPRALETPEDVSVGGISDISNRGPLDRILVSELAHDDATLAVRIALDEALYLRREAPPRAPPNARAILVDRGIRLWGVPRFFATAVALAFAATADPRADVHVWGSGGGLDPVTLTERDGLVRHLEALDLAPHPAADMEAFLGVCEELEESADAVLITHPRCLDEAELRRAIDAALAQHRGRRLHVATVDDAGRYRLVLWSRRGERELHKARLDLADLDGRAGAPDLMDADRRERPVIFDRPIFPLRLPHPRRVAHTVGPDGVTVVTPDGRLLLWDWPERGARQLAETVPDGEILWLDNPSPGIVELGVLEERRLHCASITTADARGRWSVFDVSAIDDERVAGCRHRETTLLFGHSRAWSIAPGTDGPAPVPLPVDLQWVAGRCFRGPQGWHAVGGASGPRVTRLAPAALDAGETIVGVIEGRESDGPWLVTARGRFVPTGSGEGVEFAGLTPMGVVAVSADGRRAHIACRPCAACDGAEAVIVDLEQRRLGVADDGSPALALEPRLAELETQRPRLKHVLVGFYVDAEGLHLVGAGGGRLVLQVQGGAPRLVAREGPEAVTVYLFRPVAGPPGARYELAVGELPSGTRLHLDSRGLIHLTRSGVAQMAVVLAEGEASGWHSALGGFGAAYFQALPGARAAREVDEALRCLVHGAP